MLAALLFMTAADPGLTLDPPRLPAGTERVYQGTAEEIGRELGNPFRKRHELEVRLLVLAAHPGGSDCAILTRIWPLADPVVAGPAAALTGRGVKERGDPSVRLDLIRVGPRGRVSRLATDPFAVGPSAVVEPLPESPVDRLPIIETGFFVPLPPRPVHVGDTWDDSGLVWTVGAESSWHGAASVAVTASRQVADGVIGWRRADALTVLWADGFAVALDRTVERREGGSIVGELKVNYTRVAAGRLVGGLLQSARRECEAACGFAAELSPLIAQGARADKRLVRQRLVKVQRYLADRPVHLPFREAVEAVRAGGEALLNR